MGALPIADTAKALRPGHGTLSADDIVLYCLNNPRVRRPVLSGRTVTGEELKREIDTCRSAATSSQVTNISIFIRW